MKQRTYLTPEQRAGMKARKRTAAINMRVTVEQYERYLELGGANAIRRMLESTWPGEKIEQAN